MQEGQLSPPFQISPAEADISNARQVFDLESPRITVNPLATTASIILNYSLQEPEWLNEIVGDDGEGEEENLGRTYLATKTLPGGEGAFAYLAVSLAEDEPKWLGGGERWEFDI